MTTTRGRGTARKGDTFTAPIYLVARREAERIIADGHIVSEIIPTRSNRWTFLVLS